MPPKQKTTPPIDRPLSRAYLREFAGWSTAYPPGASEPTSLRLMENVQIQRDGSVRVRPGLRYLSIMEPGIAIDQEIVGSHEPFFLANGSKAYLFAVREDDDTVGFRVLANTGLGLVVQALTATGVDFAIPQTEAVLAFTAATTYVKYLQIDNKIFALSDAGEPMRLFYVGNEKRAKKLTAIERPEWTVDDKLTVVHPDQAWITDGIPTAVRYNLIPNPAFETNVDYWAGQPGTGISKSSTEARTGASSMRLETYWVRENLMTHPLRGPVVSSAGWLGGTGGTLSVVGGYLRTTIPPGAGVRGYANSPMMSGVAPGYYYRAAYDIANFSTAEGRLYCLFRFFGANGAQVGVDIEVDMPDANGRQYSPLVLAPAGAVYMQIYPFMVNVTSGAQSYDIRNVLVTPQYNDVSYFDGASGANYFWDGAADASRSTYHPPARVAAITSPMTVIEALDYAASLYLKAGTTARDFTVRIHWLNWIGSTISTTSSPVTDATAVWTRGSELNAAPAGATMARVEVISDDPDIVRGEYHYVDDVLFEQSAVLGSYFDGDDADTSSVNYSWSGTPHGSSSARTEFTAGTVLPPAETKTAATLISSDDAANIYNFGFFYTFSNEVGESAASQVTVVKAQRGWSAWRWETPNAAGEPSGTETSDPAAAADQLAAFMASVVFEEALAQGATSWNLYMLTWAETDPMPVQALKIASRPLTPDSLHGPHGWLRATPQQAEANAGISVLPTLANRFNYSDPSKGGQGLVAADRMIMVLDPTAPAVIRWSSNQQGNYTDFSASKGGGYKTLTSGNMFVPACVKLWQNPQSVDTLTILCLGIDGYSAGYYMAPAEITSQSESTAIMAFEETTATPGTVSPYGCEVLNSALYHPLDEQLMKSTANNYNITHTSMTEQIQDVWRDLQTKEHIVSSQHDNRLYFLVHNQEGEPLEEGCWGNEVWVFDAASKPGNWSRWKAQGKSLRKMQHGNRIVMSLTRPDGIYYFDEEYSADDYVEGGEVLSRYIPWLLETNTQGANRAHDAWAHLRQAQINLGNFQGKVQWGVRGHDLHGKTVDVSKITTDNEATSSLAWDREDFLSVRRDMKEWFFYANSVVDDDDVVEHSSGQITLVQYRYAPVTVNVGYEFGSIETFEYGRDTAGAVSSVSDSGVPQPYVDTGRP